MAFKGQGKIVDRGDCAQIFGVSQTTIEQWIRRGMPFQKRGGRGKSWEINTAEVTAWLKQRATEEASGSSGAGEAELKRRKLEAETNKSELELAKLKGEVVPLKQVERALAGVFSEVKTNIRTVPSRVSTMLIGETNETRIKQVLLREIDVVLESFDSFDLNDEELDDEV
jgi:Phage DNA packaging protein, Nu1 subunit of terminase